MKLCVIALSVVLATFCQTSSAKKHHCSKYRSVRKADSCCSVRNTVCCYVHDRCYCNGFYFHHLKLLPACSFLPSDESRQCCGHYVEQHSCRRTCHHRRHHHRRRYVYVRSEREKNMTCGRGRVRAGRHSLGQCYCHQDEKACFAETINEKPTTTTTTATTTTTTTPTTTTATTTPTTTTTTSTTTTETTTRPTTTTATTTTPTTTTATTTTATTTEPKPVLLCPTSPPVTSTRLLGGAVAQKCEGNGLLTIKAGDKPMCSAVVGFSPNKALNQMYITDFCKGLLQLLSPRLGNTLVINGESATLDFSSAEVIGNNISSTAIPSGFPANTICETSACVYNPATMDGLIDFSNCSTYGMDSSKQDDSGSTSSTQVKLTKQPGKCTSAARSPATECFIADNTEARSCWGDSGAPVFCQLSTTKEMVLYGLLDAPEKHAGISASNTCSGTNEFHVVTIP